MPIARLLYNPSAGKFPSLYLVNRAAQALRAIGWDIDVQISHDAQHLTALAKQAAEQGCDAIFIAGGDGTLQQGICGLLGSKTALGVLPAGTANVWAQELGLPILAWSNMMALEQAAQRYRGAEVRWMDIGMCNQKPFMLWAGAGLDGFIVHRMEPRGRWEKNLGAVGYAVSAVRSASSWNGANLRIVADGVQIEGHYMMAVVSNIRSYAGGLAKISPEALLNDGIMDLWLFTGTGLIDTMRQAGDLLSGQHVSSNRASRFPVRQLTIDSDAPLYIQLDGEPIEQTMRLELQVHPKALRVLLPLPEAEMLLSPGSDAPIETSLE